MHSSRPTNLTMSCAFMAMILPWVNSPSNETFDIQCATLCVCQIAFGSNVRSVSAVQGVTTTVAGHAVVAVVAEELVIAFRAKQPVVSASAMCDADGVEMDIVIAGVSIDDAAGNMVQDQVISSAAVNDGALLDIQFKLVGVDSQSKRAVLDPV